MKKLKTGHYEYTMDELRDICVKKCIDPTHQIIMFGASLDQFEELKKITPSWSFKSWSDLEDLP